MNINLHLEFKEIYLACQIKLQSLFDENFRKKDTSGPVVVDGAKDDHISTEK